MPNTNLKNFDSVGGFSVDNTPVVNELKEVENVRSLKLNSESLPRTYKREYIVNGINDGFLTLDNATRIQLPTSTVNFITLHVIGFNNGGVGANISLKLESCVVCDNTSDVIHKSTLKTIIRDSVPEGENWDVEPFDAGLNNEWSYALTKVGASVVEWYGCVSVISGEWQ